MSGHTSDASIVVIPPAIVYRNGGGLTNLIVQRAPEHSFVAQVAIGAAVGA